MSRPPCPHRCLGGDPFVWACRCKATPDIYSAETARDGWGSGCRVAMELRIADLEIRLDAAARADQSLRSVAAHAAGMQPASADDPEWPPRWEAIASVRIAEAEAERDAARGLLESLPTWGTYGWREAADSVRAKLAENAKQIVALVHERDEMRRELADLRTLGASIHKTVAAALEAKAKEIDAKAAAAIEASDKAEAMGDYQRANSDAGRWAAFQAAARIVRGT